MDKQTFIIIFIIAFFVGISSGMFFSDYLWIDFYTSDYYQCSLFDSSQRCNAKQGFQEALHALKKLN